METNIIKHDGSQFINLYRQAARSIHECLPFGMKDEYNIDLITDILVLGDEYNDDTKTKERIAGQVVNNSYRKNMLCYITDKLNSRHIFPTYSDIERIIGNENHQSFNIGQWNKKVA
jgi:hypothetical protein